MTKQDFDKFIALMDKTYPKQPELTKEQKGVLWISLQKYPTKEVYTAFVSLTECTEFGIWKPQVPANLTKYLMKPEIQMTKYFQDLLAKKPVEDEIATKVFNQIGGASLFKMLEKDYKYYLSLFISNYKYEMNIQNYENLTLEQKKKLIC